MEVETLEVELEVRVERLLIAFVVCVDAAVELVFGAVNPSCASRSEYAAEADASGPANLMVRPVV